MIGAAFGKIVDSIVTDLFLPLITFITGGQINYANSFIALSKVPDGVPMTLEAVRKAGVNVLAWGNFLSIALNFIILAFIVFLVVKWLAALKSPASETTAAPSEPVVTEDIALLREIRDQLKR
jgi:large conductance mechanosensitive channel